MSIESKKPKYRFKEFSDDWDEKKLSDLLFEHKERNLKGEFDKNDVLSVSRTHGIVNQIEHLGRSYAGVSVLNYHIVRKNDIVYTKSPLALAPYGIIKSNKNKEGIVSTLYAVYRCKSNVSSDFIDLYFSLEEHLNKYLRPLVQKGAKNDMKINNQRVLIDSIYIPKTEKEQEKVSSFLTSIDNKIEQLTKKEIFLQQYKKGVMQKIFNQKIRFKKDDGSEFPEWQKKSIGEVFKQRIEKNAENLELLSVTMSDGVKKREDISTKNNSSENKNNYLRVYKNDIVYNSMRMWQGASGVSHYNGIVSPAYTVLKGNDKNSSLFFAYYFKIQKIIHIFQRNSQGLTSDTWNLKYPQLAKIKLTCPHKDEQIKIADFLSSIDSKIEKIQNQLRLTKEFKKGLLQRMFV